MSKSFSFYSEISTFIVALGLPSLHGYFFAFHESSGGLHPSWLVPNLDHQFNCDHWHGGALCACIGLALPWKPQREGSKMSSGSENSMWTSKLRRSWQKNLPIEKLLPDTQPAYVASWIYLFGVATLAALGVIIASGLVLAFEGASWYHFSSIGHFVNSMHFWSVQFFFVFMVVHLWGKFWMAAWRGRRVLTWITGAIAFVASIGTAFTGYLIQSNFDSQWISFEAKDGFNSVGIGSRFNVTNFGQMLLLHVAFLPLVLGVITVLHVLMVRAKGVVPPIDAFNHVLGERK